MSTPPAITVVPTRLSDPNLVWLREDGADIGPQRDPGHPDLTGRANRLDDVHGVIRGGDLVVSTAGNFNRYLNAFMRQVYLPANPQVQQYFYTTSPPISVQQIDNGGRVAVGNVEFVGVPHVVMGPNDVMNAHISHGHNDGPAASILSNHGNVLLVRAGNPKGIHCLEDLVGRRTIVSSRLEAGSYGNYTSSIWNITFWKHRNAGETFQSACDAADQLFDAIMNPGNPKKIVEGDRIMHRDTPQAIADGVAHAGLLFYHLAQTAVEANPGLFEIVPLGGTVEDPQPLLGNRVATMRALKISAAVGGFGAQELANRDAFFDAITDTAANAALLGQFWVREPVGTGNNQPTPA
ncbi:MAG: hypothetical protein KDK70_22240 [Myxococcales bacterium]|nr:hypothetical protein [Myxococcales bacterium]